MQGVSTSPVSRTINIQSYRKQIGYVGQDCTGMECTSNPSKATPPRPGSCLGTRDGDWKHRPQGFRAISLPPKVAIESPLKGKSSDP